MFYDKDLMNSSSLGKAWRAGHYINYDSDEEVSLSTICEKLSGWVGGGAAEARRRLALRPAAVLLAGAARVYKRRVQLLFDDFEKLEREMVLPKRARYCINRNDSNAFDESVGNSTRSIQRVLFERRNRALASRNTLSQIDHSSQSDSSNYRESLSEPAQKVDKAVQTSASRPVADHERCLPFGYVIIHDDYDSRVPSRIIVSSLNPDVLKL